MSKKRYKEIKLALDIFVFFAFSLTEKIDYDKVRENYANFQ